LGEQVGNYRLLEKLGSGGMGVVWRAEHVAIGRKAAIKMIRPDLSGDAELTKRFFNEARSAAQIDHPGMVSILDFGHHTDGSAFIVMELLNGEPLSARLKRAGPLEILEIVGLARQVASTLAVVHAAGTIHRDLKPDNVFLVDDRDLPLGVRVKLLDFGIAKLTDGTTYTQTGAIMGTPAYMAPEQCRGAGQVDHRADIYSLGCMMFEMACGRLPFTAGSLAALIGAQLHEAAPPARSLRPSIPLELDGLIARMLAKEPDDRPRSMAEVAGALDRLAPTSTPGAVASPTAPTWIAKPRARPWLALSAALVAFGGLGVYLVGHTRAAPPTSMPASRPGSYDDHGVRFSYSTKMKVGTEVSATTTRISAETPGSVLFVINRYPIAGDPQHMRDYLVERLGESFAARNLGYKKVADSLVQRTLAGAARTGRRLDYELGGALSHTDAYVFSDGDGRLVSITFGNQVAEEQEASELFKQIEDSLEISP
jgi:serine/threonine protein kinase